MCIDPRVRRELLIFVEWTVESHFDGRSMQAVANPKGVLRVPGRSDLFRAAS
jgi:hypothetical protein